MEIVKGSKGSREFKYLDDELEHPLILDYQIIEYQGKNEDKEVVTKQVIVFDINDQQHEDSRNYCKQSRAFRYYSALNKTDEGDDLDKLPKIFLGDLSKYTPEQRAFIFLHEIGHLEHPEHKGGTENRNVEHEKQADDYALTYRTSSRKNISLAQPALDFFKEMEQTGEIKDRIKNIEDKFIKRKKTAI
ncbi:MAG: hypothetical protein ABS939_00760 [Psychrobacillus sp.]